MSAYDMVQLDSLEFDTADATYNSSAMLDDTHFVVSYTGTSGDGYVSVFSIDDDYNITKLNTLEFDTSDGTYTSVVILNSDHFAVAYCGVSGDGFVSTFSLDTSYNITKIATLEFDTSNAIEICMAALDSNHLFIAYQGVDGDGFAVTITVSSSYGLTKNNSLEFNTYSATCLSIAKIDSTHCAVAYRGGNGQVGVIEVFAVDGSYAISSVGSKQFASSGSGVTNTSIALLDSSHLLVAYALDVGLYVTSYSFNTSYSFTLMNAYSTGTSTTYDYLSLVRLNNHHVATAYTFYPNTGNKSRIGAFKLDDSYTISNVATFLNESYECLYHSLTTIDEEHLLLAFTGSSADGYVKTIRIDLPALGNPLFFGMNF